MKVCFFVRGVDPELLAKMAFYADDLQILRDLGHDVTVCRQIRKLPLNADLYFCWWVGWGTIPLAITRLIGRPCIIVSPIHAKDPHGFWSRPYWERAAIKWTVAHVDRLLAVSEIEYRGALEIGGRNVRMVYHCVRPPADVKAKEGRRPVVFSIGHLYEAAIKRKKFDNVVRSIPYVTARRPDIRFVMAGSIGKGFFLDRLAKELGVEGAISFPGRISNEERERHYATNMVLAQPSEYEGFGVAQLEAMSFGLPVVTNPAGAIPEVVGNAGMYCDPESPVSIAEAILKLVEDEGAWRNASEMGRRRAIELFSYEKRRREIQIVIEELCAR